MIHDSARPVLDVSQLPATAFDSRAPVWWGNLLLMAIESTTLALLLASYFFLSRNFETWPPPKVDGVPPLQSAIPDLWAGTLNMLLLAASCWPMAWTDAEARQRHTRSVLIGMVVTGVCGIASVALRFAEFWTIRVRWDDNAYGSIVWAMLFMHLTYIVMEVLEILLMAFWVARHGCDDKHAVDVTLTASTWYWVVGTEALVYAVIYWVPRLA